MVHRLAAGALVVCCAAGCPAPKKPPPICEDTFIGDPTQAPEAMIVVSDGLSSVLADVGDGDAVPLVRPPQGGQVTYAAMRVRNMNRCGVQLAGRFADPTTMAELGFDRRTVDLVVGTDGWGRPDATHLSNLANIPLCPDNDPTRDDQGRAALLQLTAADQHGHTVTMSASVVPTCTSPEAATRALCVCECSHLPPTGRSCAANDGGM